MLLRGVLKVHARPSCSLAARGRTECQFQVQLNCSGDTRGANYDWGKQLCACGAQWRENYEITIDRP